jgi:hypothetical protein
MSGFGGLGWGVTQINQPTGSEIILNFDNVQKAYGTRGYAAKSSPRVRERERVIISILLMLCNTKL